MDLIAIGPSFLDEVQMLCPPRKKKQITSRKTRCFNYNNDFKTPFIGDMCHGQKSQYWGWSSHLLIGILIMGI